ncbi:MAG: pyridoxal-phosphate-dependent aminotransferase family protein [Acidimicrobiales bacterium]
MDLRRGIEMVAIPGPSIVPERVRVAMARAMPNIYAGPLLELSDRVLERLPALVRTSGRSFIVTSNGHGAWQMAVSNTLSPGDKVLALESGRFAVIWAEFAEMAGVEAEVLPGDFFTPVDPAALEARLRADVKHEINAILLSHTDTSSSVRNDIPAIRAAIDAAGHPALLMVDCIASLACDPYEMDEWGVDLTVSASQKGLMCPPGLGFVWAGERALAAFDRIGNRVGYVDWARRLEPRGFYDTYAGTPPVAHLHALDEALTMIDEEGGLDAVWARHAALAAGVRAAVTAWATPGGLSLNIESVEHRSNAVTTVRTGEIDSLELMQRCVERSGVTLGIGMMVAPDRSFRIGHMGHLNPPMILGTLGTIEATLVSMGAAIGGSGVAAAAETIGKALAS